MNRFLFYAVRKGFLIGLFVCIALVNSVFAVKAQTTICALSVNTPYKTENSNAVYYISSDCSKLPIKNADVYFSHFSSWQQVQTTNTSMLDQLLNNPTSFLPWGPRRSFQSGSLIKTIDNPTIYLLLNNTLYPIDSEQTFQSLGLDWSWVEDVTSDVLSRFAQGSMITGTSGYLDGFMFKYPDSADIYVIHNNTTSSIGATKERVLSWNDVMSRYRPDRIAVLPTTQTFPDTGQPGAGTSTPDGTPPTSTPTTTTSTPSSPDTSTSTITTTSYDVVVDSVQELRDVFTRSRPGMTIILQPGIYDLAGRRIATTHGGTAQAPITIRGINTQSVVIQTNGAEEAFQVSHPYYTFDNLTIEVGGRGSYHAYKLDTDGHDITIRHNVLVVMRGGEGAIKGSGSGVSPYPDNVLIEHNDISFREPTDHVVAEGIDAIGVKGWVIRNNTIHGIKHASGRTVAWGIMIKGNSQDTLIEQNLFYDTDVAISIGGTSAAQYFRDRDSQYEHRRAMVRNNVSIGSRDVALYMELAHDTHVYNNTFINSYQSGGRSAIDVRYAGSTATIINNILDKPVRDREGGSHTEMTNLVLANQYTLTDFANIREYDLRPSVGSSLYGAVAGRGTVVAGLANDFTGQPRPTDRVAIGAYELPIVPADSNRLATSFPTMTNPPMTKKIIPPENDVVEKYTGNQSRAPQASRVELNVSLQQEQNTGLPGMYNGSIVAADFDGDGDKDIAMIGHYRTMYHSRDNQTGGSEELRLYKNVSAPGGAIRFEFVQTLPNSNGNRGAMLVVGDFSGDGRPDIAAQTRNGGNVTSFINNGNWQFSSYQLNFANNSNSLGMAAADVDRDGRDDLIFHTDGGVGGGLWYRFSPAAFTWQAYQTDFPHRISYGGTIAAGDVTGDGYPDIAVGGNSSIPFGSYDCRSNLMYGQIHANQGGATGFAMSPLSVVSAFGLKIPAAERTNIHSCEGMDNAQMAIADLDGDGHKDVVIAGSSTGQNGPEGMNGQHYDFAVLFNTQGTGRNFEIWEHVGPQYPNGTTNGGVGNLDYPNIAIGDITGDGHPDVFIEGHRRDFTVARNPYQYDNILFVNNGNRSFTAVSMERYLPRFGAQEVLPGNLGFLQGRPRFVGEGGDVIADFNSDGKQDLIFSGAELPYHTNGVNDRDYNTISTIKTYVFRNMR